MRPSVFFFPLAIAGMLALNSCSGQKLPALRTYDMGQRVELGHLIFTVFETQWLPQIGSGPTARVPQNRFFLIRLSAVDSGADEVIVPNVTLVDDSGNQHDEVPDGEGVPQWIGFLRKVRPADSLSGNIVFDVAPKHYKLRLTDENGDKAALVDIPLSFNAETPNLPTPGNSAAGAVQK